MAGWKAKGEIHSYTLTLTADATSTELPGDFMYKGTYLLPAEYEASLDDAITITLKNARGRDFFDGQGTLTTATTAGHISPLDRWPIQDTLYYVVSGIGSGNFVVTFNFAKSNDI